MGTCYLWTKKQFKENIDKLMNDDEIIIFSNILQGSMHGSSKNRMKGFEIGFTNDCFKYPEDIHDLMNSKLGAIIVLNKTHWNDEIKAFYEKSKEVTNKS